MKATTGKKSRRPALQSGRFIRQAATGCMLLMLAGSANFDASAAEKPDCKAADCASTKGAIRDASTLAPPTLWAAWVATYYQQDGPGNLIRLCSGIQIQANWVLTAKNCLNNSAGNDSRTATVATVAFSTGATGNPPSNQVTADIYPSPDSGDIMLLKLRSPHSMSEYAPISFDTVNAPLFPVTTLGYQTYPGYDDPVLVQEDTNTLGLGQGTVAVGGGCDLADTVTYDKGGPMLSNDNGAILGILSYGMPMNDLCIYTLVYPYQDWIKSLVPGL